MITPVTRLGSDESGQSLVEFALVATFLLLPLLGGIVFIGAMVVKQEQLAIAARHVARTAALESTRAALAEAKGTAAPATAAVRDRAMREADVAAKAEKVNWSGIGSMVGAPGKLRAIDNHTAALEHKQQFSVTDATGGNAKRYTFGIGVLYHGVTASHSYTEFAPLGRFSNLLTPTVSATSVMPSELMPRGDTRRKVQGILDMNDWITGIVNEPAPKLP